jgi:hypothetical protein
MKLEDQLIAIALCVVVIILAYRTFFPILLEVVTR